MSYERVVLEYLREQNKTKRLGKMTFLEILDELMSKYKIREKLGRKILVKYLDEEFDGVS